MPEENLLASPRSAAAPLPQCVPAGGGGRKGREDASLGCPNTCILCRTVDNGMCVFLLLRGRSARFRHSTEAAASFQFAAYRLRSYRVWLFFQDRFAAALRSRKPNSCQAGF